MTGREGNSTSFTVFNGLRTDTPASKCPPDYSPDCSDMVFTVGGMATRPPLRVVDTLPAEIVYRKEFVGRDGALHVLFLCVDGSLYAQQGTTYTLLDTVTPGSTCNSVTAYGREYMAFFIDGEGGTDAPRCWDGNAIYRVSQGGPGAAPMVTCVALPAVSLVTGSVGASIPVNTVTPTDPQQVQVGGGGYQQPGDGGYDPPTYQTYYFSLLVQTAAPHGLSGGENVSISGNSYWNLNVAYVSQVIDTTSFKISIQTTDSTVGNGGTVAISAPLLSRKNGAARAATANPHGLRPGYKAAISGVPDLAYTITTITTDPDSYPGQAQIAFPNPPGFVPGDTISITGVPFVNAGNGVLGYDIRNGIASVTTNQPHGLSAGLSVVVSLHTYAPRTVTVDSVLSDTVWTYETTEPNVTDTGGYVHVLFPGEDGATYTVQDIVDANTIRIAFSQPKFQWAGGSVTFPWDGAFYVDSVPTATTFTYRQSGPDATQQTGTGTVTPQGQISPGEHQCCEHYITQTGFITPPSPPFRFTAKVNQYPLVTLSQGPANIKARVLSFTAVNGSAFGMLLVPARVGGVQVSTSFVVQDNTTPSAIVDFPDTALLAAAVTHIDVPGNNLFQVFPLTTPDGVEWYQGRLAWKGEKNVVLGLQNMAFDGGTAFGDTAPRGWTMVGPGGAVTQTGFMPTYTVQPGQTGEIQQSVVRRYDGGQILEENERHTMRMWVDAAHPGTITATLQSQSTGYSSAAVLSMTGRGYMQATFDADTPASIPDDMVLDLLFNSTDTVSVRDMQMVYTRNPNRWPTAWLSYVQRPDTYDAITGFLGPSDDSTELRAMFRLQENFYFLTARSLYYTQVINNQEPASWGVQGLADNCPAFNANAVVTGNTWAVWAGNKGLFWFTGGQPNRASAVIDPTWQTLTGVTNLVNDATSKRIYVGAVKGSARSLLVYDYHELELGGGSGKWSPWARSVARTSLSAANTVLFCLGANTYRLDIAAGAADDNLGSIGGYYTFAASAADSLSRKQYGSLFLRMSGTGTMTPFLYSNSLTASPTVLGATDLSVLPDVVAEYNTIARRARQLFVKIGQPGMQFTMEQTDIMWQLDPNAPFSGTRK